MKNKRLQEIVKIGNPEMVALAKEVIHARKLKKDKFELFCQINCSGGCPCCSYANEGETPRHDEHTWKCHKSYVVEWRKNFASGHGPLWFNRHPKHIEPKCTC